MTTKKSLFISAGILFWSLTLIFTLLPSWPHIYYRLSPQTSTVLASTIASTASQAQETIKKPSPTPPTLTPTPTQIPRPALPEVDPSLPKENGLIIDKIGVRGEIHEGEDWQQILRQGIWRFPNFDIPSSNYQPIILAAHRWGYLEWSPSFRKLNSFYSLPQLKEGDTIKIIWEQRPFEYRVYLTETGTNITDYNADLILYTCQLWNSPVRFFVYTTRTN